MSERISWKTCPRCGRPAAVGWAAIVGVEGEPLGEDPVEFDCVAGCQFSASQVAAVLGARGAAPPRRWAGPRRGR